MDHLTSSTDSNKVGFLGVGHAVPSIIRDNSTWPKALLDKLEARRAQTFIDPDESKLARGSAEDKIQLEEMLKWRDVAFFGTHVRRVCETNRVASSL